MPTIFGLDAIQQILAWLIITSVVFFLGAITMFIIDRRYPRVVFECYTGPQNRHRAVYRNYNGKVVPNNIFQILLRGNRILGPPLSSFSFIFEPARFGIKKLYLAQLAQGELIPIRIQAHEFRPEVIQTAKEIATRYVTTLENTRTELEKHNPLIVALVATVPIGIIVLLTGILGYLIIVNTVPQMLSILQQISTIQAQTAAQLQNITQIINASATTTTAAGNQTIYIPAPIMR